MALSIVSKNGEIFNTNWGRLTLRFLRILLPLYHALFNKKLLTLHFTTCSPKVRKRGSKKALKKGVSFMSSAGKKLARSNVLFMLLYVGFLTTKRAISIFVFHLFNISECLAF